MTPPPALADELEVFVREVRPVPTSREARLDKIAPVLGRRWFTRADYVRLHPRLSTASASRDLAAAVAGRRLVMEGDGRTARYRLR